jgi:hypothetical protein
VVWHMCDENAHHLSRFHPHSTTAIGCPRAPSPILPFQHFLQGTPEIGAYHWQTLTRRCCSLRVTLDVGAHGLSLRVSDYAGVRTKRTFRIEWPVQSRPVRKSIHDICYRSDDSFQFYYRKGSRVNDSDAVLQPKFQRINNQCRW